MRTTIRGVFGFAVYYLGFFYFLVFLPLIDRRETEARFRARLRRGTRLVLRAFGVRLNVVGQHNLCDQTNAIIVANHSSWFDQMALVAGLDVPIAFVANQKYFRYWGLRTLLRKLRSVAVFGSHVSDSLRECENVLAKGTWLVIYPEGTRSHSLLPFRRGAAVLARKTGVPTQPIVIQGSREILPRQHSLHRVRPGTITLEILPLIRNAQSVTTKEYITQIEQCFANRLLTQNADALPVIVNSEDSLQLSPALSSHPVADSGTMAYAANDSAESLSSPISNRKTAAGPPSPADVPSNAVLAELQPSNLLGGFYFCFASLLTATSVYLSLSPSFQVWVTGQLLLAVVMIQWFAIVHEAGHKTLFRTRWLNRWAAHAAGFFALIPGDCWRLVHARHHYWTGWQDRDITTQTLVPRPLRLFERITINTCWRLWLPLFATLYRLNNYWNLPRLWRLFPRPGQRRLLTLNILIYGAAYMALTISLGWDVVLRTVGLGLLITLSLQDLLILSQHTHIPMKLAGDGAVEPFAPVEQEVFTRSLIFPSWFARLILLNLDAHGLHHMFPRVPGYHLHGLQDRDTMNSILWWKWVISAKVVSGEVLLFRNRHQTGLYF